jgi:hypothetical protein
MKASFEKAAATKILRDGVAKGYWTVEQLDNPSPGTETLLREWSRHPMNQSLKIQQPSYRNLLRDFEEKQNTDFML